MTSPNVIGLIPAAGQAKRIAPLPCSKELYPIGFSTERGRHSAHPKVVSQYLLEKMRLAGISKVYFVLRTGKWDIPAYFGDGSMFDMRFAYLTLSSSLGVPFTIDHAYEFVRDATIAFGFPDILFNPNDAFVKLLARQSETQSDVALGLCAKKHDSKYDVVDVDSNGVVRDLILSASDTALPYSWAIATWTPVFTEFLHDYVNQHRSPASAVPELTAGHAIKASIEAGLKVEAVVLSEEPYLDIGTPDDLAKATQRGLEKYF